MNYHYPIDPDWSTEEVMQVIQFFNTVESAYEEQVTAKQVLDDYKQFKAVVPSKSEEKSMFKTFEKETDYIPYRVVKKAQELNEQDSFSMT
ncbi:UPF0223 family protein [Alkalibacillus almallahensis]|uniref:UPF0223 family protein n=1 Tax=Alkalibacillus almallahensis TaxID=1379154 RepID=UPI0014238E24|nr:UPF0223 family protein [Alkalibacillus almallahensis]NIK10644.1 uncharacterized protein YktA (UPF0223 family) [Alkalibacillus almallahensis]